MLTKSEKRILELVALGLNNVDICNKLFISDSTIRTHLKSIYIKTGIVSNHHSKRGRLIAYAHLKEKILDYLR